MAYAGNSGLKLGVNGFGSIGKLESSTVIKKGERIDQINNDSKRTNKPLSSTPEPTGRYLEVKLKKWKFKRCLFDISFFRFKFEIERQPTLKQVFIKSFPV